jgi:hypothetical protein
VQKKSKDDKKQASSKESQKKMRTRLKAMGPKNSKCESDNTRENRLKKPKRGKKEVERN